MNRLVALVIGLVGLIVLIPILAMGAIANTDDPNPLPEQPVPTERITVTAPPPPTVTVTAPPVLNRVVKCEPLILGDKIKVICTLGGIKVFNFTYDLPTVEVPVPEISEITEFVTLPPLPGPTETVRVPGPTVTNNVPGPTSTVSIPGPTETVTESITASPGQGDTMPGTIDPPDKEPAVNLPEINLSLPQAVGLGIATVIAVMVLILAGMYGGYYLGHRDGTKEEVTFLRALLGKNK